MGDETLRRFPRRCDDGVSSEEEADLIHCFSQVEGARIKPNVFSHLDFEYP